MASSGQYLYEYPRPAVTVDALVFVLGADGLELVVIERGHEPYAGRFALPGGFVDPDEPLESAARRELSEETSLTCGPMFQVGAFGDPGRDPRGHTIGVGFVSLMPRRDIAARLAAGDDAAEAKIEPLASLPSLAFDHDDFIDAAREQLALRVWREPLVFDLFEASFRRERLALALNELSGSPEQGAWLLERMEVNGHIEREPSGLLRRRAPSESFDLTR